MLLDQPAVAELVAGAELEVGDADIMPGDPVDQRLHRALLEHVVAVDEQQVFARGNFEPCVASGTRPAVWLVDHPDPVVLIGESPAKSQALVLAAVIDQDDLIIAKALPQYALQTAWQASLGVVYRDNHAD